MQLLHFIKTLLIEGKVSVENELYSFIQKDNDETIKLLKKYYQDDLLEMPYIVPTFSESGALWAAQYFFTSVQLTVLRNIDSETIQEKLTSFTGEINASNIYSIDLIFRYLPTLFKLVKGLAPSDILVQELYKTALAWPFSSVGMEITEQINDDIILETPSLKLAYVDKVIKCKDKQRVIKQGLEKHIREVTGEHIKNLWPHFKNEINS